MLRISILEIDDHILDKIESRHGVSLGEATQACQSEFVHVRRGREGLYSVYSQTDAGRYLLVILASQGGGTWRIVTAREMTQQERRLYARARGA